MVEEEVTELLVDATEGWNVLELTTTQDVESVSVPPPGPVSSTGCPGIPFRNVGQTTATATSCVSGTVVPPGVLIPRVRGATATATSSDSGTAVPPSILTPGVSGAAATATPRGHVPPVRPRSLNFDDRAAGRLSRGSVRTGIRQVASDSTASEKVNEAIVKFYKQEEIGRRKARYWFKSFTNFDSLEKNLKGQCQENSWSTKLLGSCVRCKH